MASVVESDAISLGFPPYRRSPLQSKTYQTFVQILSLFDQSSHLISPSSPPPPPPIPSSQIPIESTELGQEIQSKQGTCISKDNQVQQITQEEEVDTDKTEIEEGQISDDNNAEDINILDDDSIAQKETYKSDLLLNSNSSIVSEFLLPSKDLKEKSVELSCRKICSYEEIAGDYGICDGRFDRKQVKKPKPDDTTHSNRNEVKQSSVKGSEAGSKRKRNEKSKESKEKRKANRRKKRAEENQKAGVKRLRLEPNPKEKTVKYCKYFLQGKCQQGDSCKFSHDVTPLTKSKPCNFLARNSCLKGDDCPYDHELSKYPCDSYKSKGFCHRGDKCLFSHKMSLMDGSSPASDVCKNTQEGTSLQATTSSGKQMPNGSTSNRTPAMSKVLTPKAPVSSGTITQHGLQGAEVKPPVHVPKGISFLSFDGSSKQQKGELPAVRGNGVSGSSINQGAVEKFHNSNDIISGRKATLSVSQSLKMTVADMMHDKRKTSNLAQSPMTQVTTSTSYSAQKEQSSTTSRYPVQSTASIGNLPTISNILQEFLFNGQ